MTHKELNGCDTDTKIDFVCAPPTPKKTTSDKTNMRNLVFNCRRYARALNCFANTVVVQKCVSYLILLLHTTYTVRYT